MSVEVGRRVFVGSVVAGLPILAAGPEVSWAQGGNDAVARDPVALQLIDDMKSSVRALSRGSSGEQARRFASSLRLFAAWGASHQFDARVQETLLGVIAREGRDALVHRDMDAAMFRAEAREAGFDGTSVVPLPIMPPADYALRERVLADLLTRGATPYWQEVARTLEAASALMDRQAAASDPGIRRVAQVDPYCTTINQQLNYLNAELVFWCAPWFYWVPEPCALVSSTYLAIWLASWYRGC